MRAIFGPNTRQVLKLLIQIRDLSPEQMDRVAAVWKQTSSQTRAEAWVEVQQTTTPEEWYRITIASSVARRTALEAARHQDRNDWAFWAAVADAAGAVADSNRMGEHYDVLVAPLATALPWLPRRHPARTARRPGTGVLERGT